MRNIICLTIATLLSVSFFTETASAEIQAKPPEVCGYVADIGLATRGWKTYDGNSWGCSSAYKEIGSAGPAWAPALKNNLAYYGEGTSTVVRQLKIVLNVNNRSEAKSAHSELIRAAEILVKKALGKPLPSKIRDAIANGNDSSLKTGGATIKVIREDWSTGKGYEVNVVIK